MASCAETDDAALRSLLWTSNQEDDAVFLHDAMAFLDAAERDSAQPREAKRMRPIVETAKITTVTRRRHEIVELRSDVAALEAIAALLRKRRREQATHGSDAWVVDTATLWEQLATRQRALRDQATQENQRLKRALDELLRQRDALAVLLRPKRANPTGPPGHTDGDARPPRGPRVQASLFGELVGSLRQQYLHTARILAITRALEAYHPLRSCYHASITPRKTIQLVEHVIYPFSYQDTVPEVWEALSGVADAKPGINFSSVDMQEDSFRLELTIDVQLQRTRADFQLQTVAKRIVEPHRTVIVWTGVAVPNGVGGTSMDGISVRQRGWSVIEPVEVTSGSTRAATRLTMFFEDEVLMENSVKKKASKVAQLLQFLMGIYTLESGVRREQTENKLMEKALRAGKATAA